MRRTEVVTLLLSLMAVSPVALAAQAPSGEISGWAITTRVRRSCPQGD